MAESESRILCAAALIILLLSGCAGMLPTSTTGSSRVHIAASEEFPKRAYVAVIQVGSQSDLTKIATETFSSELAKLGFVVGEQGKDAEFTGDLTWTQHELIGIDARLTIGLVDPKSRVMIWSAEVSKNRDIHTSFVSTIEKLVRYSTALLEQDIEAHDKRNRP